MKPPRTILSIDWDFFFPSPEGNPACDGETVSLFDWGHSESHSPGVEYVLWVSRAASLKLAGRSFPTLDPAYQDFGQRFRFAPDCRLVAADSHAAIYPLLQRRDHVVNFDAHHDAGYGRLDYWNRPADCSNWARYAWKFHRVETVVVYPNWKHWAMDGEPDPRCKGVTRTKGGTIVADYYLLPPFDLVFVCRSGAWVPPVYDDAFNDLLDSFPKRLLDRKLVARPWREADVDQHVAVMRELIEKATP